MIAHAGMVHRAVALAVAAAAATDNRSRHFGQIPHRAGPNCQSEPDQAMAPVNLPGQPGVTSPGANLLKTNTREIDPDF